MSESKEYVILPEHIKAAHYTEEEYEKLWWDQDEEPNSTDGCDRKYYDLLCGYDTMDPGLISGYTTELYVLEIIDSEMVKEHYPLVQRLLDLNPVEYDPTVHSKRHLEPKDIQNAIKDIPKELLEDID